MPSLFGLIAKFNLSVELTLGAVTWFHSPQVADWFAQLNNKMGGDLKKIQTVGRYMVEVRARVQTLQSKTKCKAKQSLLHVVRQPVLLFSCRLFGAAGAGWNLW